MHISEFDFDLPSDLIAQEPAPERGNARLLRLDRLTGTITDSLITALPECLRPGDVLVVNNTRVFPARLLGRRTPSGGTVECLLIEKVPSASGSDSDQRWEALMHPGQKLKPGSQVVFEGPIPLHAEVLERRFYGRRVIRLWTDGSAPVDRAIDLAGHMPLPPYIKRPDSSTDRDRYQTVFAGAAVPWRATAGLHFLTALLDRSCNGRRDCRHHPVCGVNIPAGAVNR